METPTPGTQGPRLWVPQEWGRGDPDIGDPNVGTWGPTWVAKMARFIMVKSSRSNILFMSGRFPLQPGGVLLGPPPTR